MAKTYIEDLTPGDAVDSSFAVRSKSLQPFRSKPGSYLALTLADKTGEIPARAWDNAEKLAERFEAGEVIRLRGRVDEYQGSAQIIIERLKRLDPDDIDALDYLPTTPKDVEALLERVQEAIGTVEHEHLAALLRAFFDDDGFVRRFAEGPGAKVLHHSYLGGLLEHVVSILDMCETVCRLHPQLDRDLMMTGAILHDVGKLEELHFGTTIDYTDMGRLVGHVILTDRMVKERLATLPDFPAELEEVLAHLLLSHHGAREWGAPIVPMTPEAIALHYIDNLDAKIWQFSRIAEEAAGAGRRWSDWQRLLERYIFSGSWGADGPESGEAEGGEGQLGLTDVGE
ncbi:MAG: 3'-5' exoribonuclease YhaM family protein, partial [Armatimonadota bacterium]